jgi:hypothetical protein
LFCYRCKDPLDKPEVLSEDEVFVDNVLSLPYTLTSYRHSAIERQQAALRKLEAAKAEAAPKARNRIKSFLNTFLIKSQASKAAA